MEQHKNYWQQFAKSGDPMMYLAYKQNRQAENTNLQVHTSTFLSAEAARPFQSV